MYSMVVSVGVRNVGEVTCYMPCNGCMSVEISLKSINNDTTRVAGHSNIGDYDGMLIVSKS